MDYSSVLQVYRQDKARFFSSMTQDSTPLAVEQVVSSKPYVFLSQQQMLIEQEFHDLHQALIEQKSNSILFWLYNYYCALMLQAFFKQYGKTSEEKKYERYAKKIRNRLQANVGSAQLTDSLQQTPSFINQLFIDLKGMALVPRQTSKMRELISAGNMIRIQLVFSRITISALLMAARDLGWIDALNQLLVKPVNVDGMVAVLNNTRAVFNVLSVAIFAARFMINTGTLLKHTFFPSSPQEATLTVPQRFRIEFNKRYCDFLNDMVWGTVNALTNYAAYFHIAAPIADWILSGFLLFDVALLTYRLSLCKKEYFLKKAQYLQEKALLNQQMAASDSLEQKTKYHEALQVLDGQLQQLEITWKVKSASWLFNIAAASLLVGAYTASLVLTPVIAGPLCFLAGAIAVAMYLSADAYTKYYDNNLRLHHDRWLAKDNPILANDARKARNEFILTMVKNTALPMAFMVTFALSWPVAILLAVAYLGYQYANAQIHARPHVDQALPEPASP